MIMWLQASPVLRGALAGLLAAALIDLAAFRAWRSWHEFVSYDWRVASFRWAQGAACGALTAAGIGAL